jgi:hypothetical protein
MEVKYQLFENENLFVQKFIGEFSFENYREYTSYVLELYASKPIKKILNDFRKLVISDNIIVVNDSLERITEYRKKVNENELRDRDIKHLFWVDKPLPTTIAVLFTSNFSESNYKYCTLSDDVIDFLALPTHLSNIESIINNLKNTYKYS